MKEQVDEFGKLVMRKFRDRAFDAADRRIAGEGRAPALQSLQQALAALTPEQQEVARRLVRSAVDSALHDFLFALQEESDAGGDLRVVVRGNDVAASSDGLHGEMFGDEGWQARFSAYGQMPPEA